MARLLVIDDEPEICRFVERALQSAGHHVTSSHDGVTGLQLASEGMFDLIVLDLAMPDVDGMMVLAAVLARGARTGSWTTRPSSRLTCRVRTKALPSPGRGLGRLRPPEPAETAPSQLTPPG